jgi:uncharacterized membrane protein
MAGFCFFLHRRTIAASISIAQGALPCYNMLMNIVLLVLGLLGLFCCWAFHMEQKGASASMGGPIGYLLKCSSNACSALSRTPYHRLLRYPNYWYGTVFYLLIIGVSLTANSSAVIFGIVASLGASAMSIILIWALSKKLHIVCKICYTSHVVNMGILTVLVIRLSELV